MYMRVELLGSSKCKYKYYQNSNKKILANGMNKLFTYPMKKREGTGTLSEYQSLGKSVKPTS